LEVKKRYQNFVEENAVPAQLCDWWMDAVCGENQWNVIMSDDASAAYVYYKKKKYGSSIIEHPSLTTYSGFWVRDKVLQESHLIEFSNKIPRAGISIQKLHFQLKGLHNIHQLGYKQTSRYTHLIQLEKSLEDIFNSFKPNLKSIINKAETQLEIEDSEDLSLAYELISDSFKRQSLSAPFSFALFNQLDQALHKRKARKILIARDKNGNPLACVYIVLYNQIASYLIGGANPKYKSSNAQSLLLWNAIGIAKSSECLLFDFTGSVMPGIEKFFMAFNGQKTIVPVIYKAKNRFLEMYMNWKNFV